ncbi:hypothetical protein ACFE04_003806 [Oxalis oulophora]
MGKPSGGGGSSANPKSATASVNNDIDASVGGLVWVRRRNGSWWPGRIVSIDEVCDGSVVSPRSGTPVKLLGREDASVDWYNLEKSKRVKPFRCEEFEECIAKAKFVVANAGKKAVKYARREDAVIHALELERAGLSKDHPDSLCRTDNSGDVPGDVDHKSHSIQEREDLCEDNSEIGTDSAPALSQSGISSEESNRINVSKEKRRRTPNDSEDDGTEKTKTKRMKGLEDIGVVVRSKRKTQAGAVLEPVQLDSTTIDSNPVSNGVAINGDKNSAPSFKRKRSQVANVHEFLKKKNRRKQLTKVLESTAMVPVSCDQTLNSNGSPRQSISDTKVSVVVNNNSDSNGLSSENGSPLKASEHVVNGNHQKMKENETTSIPDLPKKDYSDGLFDVPSTVGEKSSAGVSPIVDSSFSGRHHNGVSGMHSSENSQLEAGVEIEMSGSNWQSKGKRKSRHRCKNINQDLGRYAAIGDESNDSEKTKPQSDIGPRVDFIDSFNEPRVKDLIKELKPLSDDGLKSPRTLPYRQSRYTVNSKYPSPEFLTSDVPVDSRLYDVRLDVKASDRPRDVPLVSLMSKSTGKAIVGHPLTVKVLTHGYSEQPKPISVSFNAGKHHASKSNSAPKRKKRGGSRRRSAKSKKSGALSKKTRKLSSLTGQGHIKAVKNPFADETKGPIFACVPVKLVFSRINEAVSGSARPTLSAQP